MFSENTIRHGVTQLNKRIEELAKQADLIQWDTLPSGARTPDHESVVKAKKFAELIVRECQFAIVSRTDLPKHERKLYNNVLKEHFGVEE